MLDRSIVDILISTSSSVNGPDIKELLPFLIPLIIVQFVLLAFTLRHILTHDTYKRGNRTLWVIVALIGMEFIGPILYFLLGKEDS